MPRTTAPLPATGQNFRVTIGSGRSLIELGFVRVEFPRLHVAAARVPADAPVPHLVLHRAWDGSPVLAAWWNQTRKRPRSQARDLVVELLDASASQPRLRWAFSGCKPVALQHSPLDAMQSSLLIESISLAFEGVELSAL